MTRLAPHFTRDEFRCPDGCGCDTADAELVRVLEDVRDHFGVPVLVTSGHRCEAHNRVVGGAENSQHLHGRAADIDVIGVSTTAVAAYLEAAYPDRLGIGRYATHVHVDTRTDGPARWQE